jgi:hypothetical protein
VQDFGLPVSEGEYDTQIVAKLTPVQLAKELKTLEKQMYQCI